MSNTKYTYSILHSTDIFMYNITAGVFCVRKVHSFWVICEKKFDMNISDYNFLLDGKLTHESFLFENQISANLQKISPTKYTSCTVLIMLLCAQ